MIGILGGGLSGLAFARRLKEHGFNFEILEKEKECGGLCRTRKEDGFTFDYCGSHIIFSKDKVSLEYFRSLLGENIVRRRRNTKIFYKGRMIKYPFENGLFELPKQDNYECLLHYVRAVIQKEKGDQKKPSNFKEWVYNTFGAGIAEKYMIPYNEKIWNTKSEMLGTDWVLDRVPQPPVEDVLKSAIGIETEGYTHQLYFYYPEKGGIQAMIRAIESEICESIATGFRVESIRKENGEFVVSGSGDERRYSSLVSTIPLPDIVSMVKVPQPVKEAAKKLSYNSLITVMIGLNEPELNELSWVYFPRMEDGEFNRCSFPFNYSKYVAPEGKSSALVEITCKKGDEMWGKDDEKIVSETVDKLHTHGMFDRRSVCYTAVERTKYAYVINDLDYSKNVSVLTNFLNRCGIVLCGRFSEWKYMNMDQCVQSAIEKADELVERCK